jgi:hypothetical protein
MCTAPVVITTDRDPALMSKRRPWAPFFMAESSAPAHMRGPTPGFAKPWLLRLPRQNHYLYGP